MPTEPFHKTWRLVLAIVFFLERHAYISKALTKGQIEGQGETHKVSSDENPPAARQRYRATRTISSPRPKVRAESSSV